MFLHTNHVQEICLTRYIDSKYELPYIDLRTKIKVGILPQSGQIKSIDYL